MNSEKYLYHLLVSIAWQKKNALNQKGKSDIEPPDYEERIEKWYGQIQDLVFENPPHFFVDSVNVIEDENENAISLRYQYYCESIQNEKKINIAGITFCRQ